MLLASNNNLKHAESYLQIVIQIYPQAYLLGQLYSLYQKMYQE